MHWQANKPPVLPRYTLSISSQIFQVLLLNNPAIRPLAPQGRRRHKMTAYLQVLGWRRTMPSCYNGAW